MCPNRQILSVYYDEELPSPWKEKVEAHLAVCPECRNLLERYRSFSFSAPGGEESAIDSRMEAAKNRIWQNLSPLVEKEIRVRPWDKFWQRSVSIPLPLAAAMTALVVAAFTLVFINRPAPMMVPQDIIAANGIGMDLQGITPASDIRGVLQYLSNEDDIVILRLPESKRFMSYGEPRYVKGEDYSRSTLSQ
ncbi:MAG: zf-HC2 domain-containing protein [Spirochaetaceae bacterium]|nr:zf-HC2 domain-containing protein [Spirochaetaceae bacterium]